MVTTGSSGAQTPTDTLFFLSAHIDHNQGLLFETSQSAAAIVQEQLARPWTPASFALITLSGLVTSVTPCTLSVLPLTVGYIGGYAQENTEGEGDSTPFILK